MRRALSFALTAAVALSGCSDRPAPAQAPAVPLRSYAVRGEVVKLPGPTAEGHWVAVRHEAIDDFVDASGATVGMNAMRMVFDVARSVPLDGLREGDKVELALTVGWSPPLLRVDGLRKLPPDTVLEFRAARAR